MDEKDALKRLKFIHKQLLNRNLQGDKNIIIGGPLFAELLAMDVIGNG